MKKIKFLARLSAYLVLMSMPFILGGLAVIWIIQNVKSLYIAFPLFVLIFFFGLTAFSGTLEWLGIREAEDEDN